MTMPRAEVRCTATKPDSQSLVKRNPPAQIHPVQNFPAQTTRSGFANARRRDFASRLSTQPSDCSANMDTRTPALMISSRF